MFFEDKEAAEAERERLAYASIDWHDFVVVQTVDFQPGDIGQILIDVNFVYLLIIFCL